MKENFIHLPTIKHNKQIHHIFRDLKTQTGIDSFDKIPTLKQNALHIANIRNPLVVAVFEKLHDLWGWNKSYCYTDIDRISIEKAALLVSAIRPFLSGVTEVFVPTDKRISYCHIILLFDTHVTRVQVPFENVFY